MGVSRGGKVATVTNFREPARERGGVAPSRGHLVRDFLTSDEPPEEFLDRLRPQAQSYNGFNLLLGSAERLWWYSNRDECPYRVVPGVHGLSNRLLDTPWPKVKRGKRALEHLLAGEERITSEQVFSILEDHSPAADSELPDTGVGLELERMLSAPFIRGTNYGTRSSTVLLIDHASNLTFIERSFNPKDESQKETRYEFCIES